MDGTCTKKGCITRRFIVVCRRGLEDSKFSINNLTDGRIDLKARCTNAAFFISNGLRHNTAIAFHNTVLSRSLIIHANTVRYLKPDERTIAGLIQKALLCVPSLRKRKNTSKRKTQLAHNSNGTTTGATPPSPVYGMKVQDKMDLKSLIESAIDAPTSSSSASNMGTVIIYLDVLGIPIDIAMSQLRERLYHGSSSISNSVVTKLDESTPTTDKFTNKKNNNNNHGAPTSEPLSRSFNKILILLGDECGFSEREKEYLSKCDSLAISLGCIPLLGSHCITILHHYIDTYLHHCVVGPAGTQRKYFFDKDVPIVEEF